MFEYSIEACLDKLCEKVSYLEDENKRLKYELDTIKQKQLTDIELIKSEIIESLNKKLKTDIILLSNKIDSICQENNYLKNDKKTFNEKILNDITIFQKEMSTSLDKNINAELEDESVNQITEITETSILTDTSKKYLTRSFGDIIHSYSVDSHYEFDGEVIDITIKLFYMSNKKTLIFAFDSDNNFYSKSATSDEKLKWYNRVYSILSSDKLKLFYNEVYYNLGKYISLNVGKININNSKFEDWFELSRYNSEYEHYKNIDGFNELFGIKIN